MVQIHGFLPALFNGSPNAFKDHSRRFASLFVALEQRTTTFGIRPKLHMFQELCEMTVGSRPAAHWTYRDEDFGGSLVALAKETRRENNP